MSEKFTFDALMIISYGGPEGMDEVMPFIEHILSGKRVTEERKKEVAEHYEMFGGISPIGAQNRELRDLLKSRFEVENIQLPIFIGNRHSPPFIKDTLVEMKEAGVKNALAYVTSAYESYSGSTQYLEYIETAQKEIGDGAPEVTKIPAFYNHPLFIQANVQQIQETIKTEFPNGLGDARFIFTAHSLPVSQKEPYVSQIRETCSQVSKKLEIGSWELVFQSRSGPPQMPWLEPDICDYLEEIKKDGVKEVLISPIGFVSDHMEVMYDLDVEAKKKADELDMRLVRAPSAGNHHLVIDMILDLIRSHPGA